MSEEGVTQIKGMTPVLEGEEALGAILVRGDPETHEELCIGLMGGPYSKEDHIGGVSTGYHLWCGKGSSPSHLPPHSPTSPQGLGWEQDSPPIV